jgi:hypothetical protein
VNANSVNHAIAEAKRFIQRAEAWKKAENDRAQSYYNNPKESGAVRRASMDLTRALADMRKPG